MPFLFCLVATAPAQRFVAAGTAEFASTPIESSSLDGTGAALAAAPSPGAIGSITGIVKDLSGDIVPGAVITLAAGDPSRQQTLASGDDGSFSFAGLSSGSYELTVVSPGFERWSTSATVEHGQSLALPEIALSLSAVGTSVEVRASTREIAEAQMGFAEKQRVLGVFPNFYASYQWDAAPLSAGQKFRLAWRFSTDPVAFGMAGVVAGTEQINKTYVGYGGGTLGYARRFGATYADGLSSTMLGQAIFPAVFHQDPRYFVKGTGSITSRALYAIATAVICRGDNGHWQANYSNILGNVASAGLSNAYYPASSRDGFGLTVQNSLVTTALGAVGGLIQEFMLHRMTPNLPDYDAAARP